MSKETLARTVVVHGAETKPKWAIGHAESYTSLGAALPTVDGRKCGNAVLCTDYGDGTYKVVSEAGNTMRLTELEIRSMFHPPVWCQYPRYTADTVRKADEQEDADGGTRLWHLAHKFPTPGMPLLLELEDGSRVQGIRPSYVTSYNVDANYQDTQGNHLQNVKRWSHA